MSVGVNVKNEFADKLNKKIFQNISEIYVLQNDSKNSSNSFSDLERELQNLKNLSVLNADYKITSHRKYYGWAIVFAKRVIRKLTRWYINPLIEQQNQYNIQQVRIIEKMIIDLKR